MRKGFTLIELLVVIAIIAILVAILFPVFLRARDNAKTTQCGSHGRQIGMASIMYMDDYSGRFPRRATPDEIKAVGTWEYNWANLGVKTWDAGWAQYRYIQMKNYVRSQDAWICPNPHGFYGKRYAFGYRSNWLPRVADDFVDGDRGFQNDKGEGLTVAQVQALDAEGKTECGPRHLPPSKKIMWVCYALGEWAIGRVGYPNWPKGTFPYYPHNGGTTYVYADGHAKWLKTGKAWAPIGYTNLWMDQAPSRVY